MAFEIVDMSLDERSRYRRLLIDSRASMVAEQESEPSAEGSEVPVGR
jgi:hypothetical protein